VAAAPKKAVLTLQQLIITAKQPRVMGVVNMSVMQLIILFLVTVEVAIFLFPLLCAVQRVNPTIARTPLPALLPVNRLKTSVIIHQRELVKVVVEVLVMFARVAVARM